MLDHPAMPFMWTACQGSLFCSLFHAVMFVDATSLYSAEGSGRLYIFGGNFGIRVTVLLWGRPYSVAVHIRDLARTHQGSSCSPVHMLELAGHISHWPGLSSHA